MKRLHVFVLSLLLALSAFMVTAPKAYAESTGEGGIENPDPNADPDPNPDPDPEPDPEPEPTTGWVEEEGSWYYVLEDGSRATGWLELDGAMYWLGEDGARRSGDWFQIDGVWYVFDAEGVMRHDTIADAGSASYYLGSDGTVTKGWVNLDGKKYYAGSDYKLYKSKWLSEGGKWYYFGSDGHMLANEATTYYGSGYYFNADGSMATGWIGVGSDWYYAGSNGKLYRYQWLNYNGTWYYFGATYKLTENGWISYNGNWYYKKSGGSWATGWNEIGGKWYYFSGSGYLFTNRWIKSGSNFYFVGTDGALYIDTKTPDGSTVDATGKRLYGPTDNKANGYSSSTGHLILINYTTHELSIYKGSRNNWKLIQCYPCSMGKDSTKTPTGTFYTTGRTYSFGDSDHTCYYATGYIGMNYLIHSVLYYPGTMTVKDGRLGYNISGGCIRLFIEDAKWIYYNVPLGTPVIIYY